MRALLRNDQRFKHALLAKRDAIIDVQAIFYGHLRHLYTWSLDRLTFASTMEVQNHWFVHIENARKCAYRAESIGPDYPYPGQMRYGLMIEIVNLETRRINEFLSKFHRHQNILTALFDEDDPEDESYCDQHILSYLDQIQTNVILSKPPQWLKDACRPFLTWYGFLSPPSEDFMEAPPPLECRLLASEYYDT